jgi:hypothetical protein
MAIRYGRTQAVSRADLQKNKRVGKMRVFANFVSSKSCLLVHKDIHKGDFKLRHYQFSGGVVQLVLFVHSDDLADEAIIGKCQLIRNQLNSFKKFSMRIGWTKMPVFASVFCVFDNSEKAFHFRQSVQANCKHYTLLSKFYVLPWGVDLSAKSVWAYKGWPPPHFKSADLEVKLFS